MPWPRRCGAVAIPRSWTPRWQAGRDVVLDPGRHADDDAVELDTEVQRARQLVLGEGDVTTRRASAQHVEAQRMGLRGRELDHRMVDHDPAT